MTGTTDRPYWWFQGASVQQLVEQLTTAGAETARLEVRIDGDDMTLRVVPSEVADAAKNGVVAESHNGEINDSHRCPPDC